MLIEFSIIHPDILHWLGCAVLCSAPYSGYAFVDDVHEVSKSPSLGG